MPRPATPSPKGGSTGREPGWRRVTAIVLAVLGCLLAPVSLVAAWGRGAATDTDAVVVALAPVATDPAVQRWLVDETVAAVESRVDLGSLVGTTTPGDTGMPADTGTGSTSTATDRARTLQESARTAFLALVRSTTERVVTSPQLASLWAGVVRTTHRQVTGALADDPDVALALSDDGALGVRLGPLVLAVREQLLDRGVSAARAIPEVDRTIVLTRVDRLPEARALYRLVVALGTWLPWVSLALLLSGVLLAPRRARALARTALGLVLALGVLLLALWLAERAAADALDPSVPSDVVHVVVDTLVGGLRRGTGIAALVAAATAAVAYLAVRRGTWGGRRASPSPAAPPAAPGAPAAASSSRAWRRGWRR